MIWTSLGLNLNLTELGIPSVMNKLCLGNKDQHMHCSFHEVAFDIRIDGDCLI
jgi:hypothetical protein